MPRTTLSIGIIRWLPSLPMDRRQAVHDIITGQSRITLTFFMMAALSTIIAAYGLLSNSTAVVIGAMLLAPLMAPIFGIALGLSIGDIQLFRGALITESIGIVIVITVSYSIGSLPWLPEFGTEIMARTQPTLFDLAIALASGLAGAYAILIERMNSSITGVAIATALVPPLATCGLCLANGHYEWALQSFVLFVANFLSIQLAGAIVFTIYGLQALHPEAAHSVPQLARRFGLSIMLLFGVALFMWQTLYHIVVDDRLNYALHQKLSLELGSTTGAMLDKVSYERRDEILQVMAVVLTPQEFDAESIEHLEGRLRSEVDPTIHLIVRSLISKDSDRQGQVFIPDAVLARQAEVSQATYLLTQVSKELRLQLANIPGARLVDLRREYSGTVDTFVAVVNTPTTVEPAQVRRLQDSLHLKVAPTAHLVVRSILTQDADAQQYLYQPKGDILTSEPNDIRIRQRLEQAAQNQFDIHMPGASLSELRYVNNNGVLNVLAIVRSPATFTSTQVKQIQGAFRKYIDSTTKLVLRSIVGADTGAEGYIMSLDESIF